MNGQAQVMIGLPVVPLRGGAGTHGRSLPLDPCLVLTRTEVYLRSASRPEGWLFLVQMLLKIHSEERQKSSSELKKKKETMTLSLANHWKMRRGACYLMCLLEIDGIPWSQPNRKWISVWNNSSYPRFFLILSRLENSNNVSNQEMEGLSRVLRNNTKFNIL